MKKATVTKTVFHLEFGENREECTVIFHPDGLTEVRNDAGEIVFIQHYYHEATLTTAMDVLETARV